jgi:hypothetical protein
MLESPPPPKVLVEPEEPDDPVEPVEPVEPDDPVEPVEPVDPVFDEPPACSLTPLSVPQLLLYHVINCCVSAGLVHVASQIPAGEVYRVLRYAL